MRFLLVIALLPLASSAAPSTADAAIESSGVDVRATTIETIVETVTRTVIHEVTDAGATETLATSAPTGVIRQCSCDEAEECRKSASGSIDTCYKACDDYLYTYGNQTESYLSCFAKDATGITESEDCLFSGMKDHCSADGEVTLIPVLREFGQKYTGFNFTTKAKKWHKHEQWIVKAHEKYDSFQRFFHCTKHCMHRRMRSCFQAKGCALRWPMSSDFRKMMDDCTRNNYKIAFSLMRTCQCLAFEKGVKSLIGNCVLAGNQYFVEQNFFKD